MMNHKRKAEQVLIRLLSEEYNVELKEENSEYIEIVLIRQSYDIPHWSGSIYFCQCGCIHTSGFIPDHYRYRVSCEQHRHTEEIRDEEEDNTKSS